MEARRTRYRGSLLSGRPPERVGDAALPPDMTPTTLRGQYPDGFFLVQVEGHRIDDSASVGKLVRLRLADLGYDPGGLFAVDAGRARAARRRPCPRGARRAHDVASRSSAPARARRRLSRRDRVGEDPLEALPKLGAFIDRSPAETVDANRIAANLRLANSRRTDAVLSGSNLAAVRTRPSACSARSTGTTSAQLKPSPR